MRGRLGDIHSHLMIAFITTQIMKRVIAFPRYALMLGLMLAGLTACDTVTNGDDFNDPELAFLTATLSEELGLSASQQGSIAETFRAYDRQDREPGFLWNVAADLQASLSDEQKETLLNRTNDMERGLSFRGLLGYPGGGGRYGIGGFRGGSGRHGIAPADEVLNLTEEQQAAMQELQVSYREQMKALVTSFRNEEVDEDTFVSEMFALRMAKRSDMDALLTEEQRAALETFRSEREAAFEAFRAAVNAVRDEVLGLSDEQIDALNSLFQDQLDSREALIEQLQAGTLSVADFQGEIEALEEARQAELTALLDASQLEIVAIHDALSVRSGKFGHRGGKGKFGQRQGHGHTFSG